MTFSLAARCSLSGRFGIVVTSSSPAVGARCAHARARVGAAASQNVTDPSLGRLLLDLLASGLSAPEAMTQLVAAAAHAEFRQLTCIDAGGLVASYSGERTLGRHASAEGAGCVAAGNLLADEGVPEAMVDAFEDVEGDDLGDRLIGALMGGLAAGGEEGPVRSAGLLIVDTVAWPVADLRVDWHDEPIHELASLWRLWQPQLDGYVARALDPSQAPSYGVPGDE
ncbi:MAG TPA: DUF1028 domain-containing protein [Gaiellales bacterium]|jgi:uncharacterized Ntn-hydrolase superfamily protein|nr:DUF1028 domain-containing protein [Gaiellales bacterium]